MPHPDYRQWLSRLREFVSGIPGSPRCVEMRVEEPGVDEESRRLLQPLIDAHPELLAGVLRFHEEAAAACDIKYIVDVPEGTCFPGREHQTNSDRIWTGFQLLSAADIVERKKGCEIGAGVLEGLYDQELEDAGISFPAVMELIRDHREKGGYRRQSVILKTCIPISALNGPTCLALVPASDGVLAGVYLVGSDSATRLCDTFDDWLQFQEKTYYPNPDCWSTLELWLADNGVEATPEMIKALGGVFGNK
ncbi:MAG TPA: hypothetical protein VG796_26895 [Verrucomicrobiales bacterium]|jgi:hypothetical protein|nr:hypothetical protein [Verrucomicrobiales bacterium]